MTKRKAKPKHRRQAAKTPIRSLQRLRTLLGVLALVVVLLVVITLQGELKEPAKTPTPPSPTPVEATGGQLVDAGTPTTYTLDQVGSLIRYRYGKTGPTPKYAVAMQTISYTSLDENNKPLEETARVYVPQDTSGQVATLAFGPGTTGVGDICAASLEQPYKVNRGNYNAHFMALATEGYVVVSTDYENAADTSGLQPYMVGDLEGRAMLDSLRVLQNLPNVAPKVNQNAQFLLGYSQGGQAAFFADAMAASYTPNLKIAGVITYAPVSSATQTLSDITHGSTLDWFGPYLLASYQDYYGNLQTDQMLLPKWNDQLVADINTHCVESAPTFWGNDPAKVFTSSFITAMQTDDYADFAALSGDLAKNEVTITTNTPQLMIQGTADNVILPSQTQAEHDRLCLTSTGSIELKTITNGTHYSIVADGLPDATSWINAVTSGHIPTTDCPTGA